MYQYGDSLNIPMALGSDFNGFISQTRPRFSTKDSSYCAPQKVKKLGANFDTTGLGNMNQTPDLIDDLHNIGINTHNLEQSATRFVDIWERSVKSSKMISTSSLQNK